MKNGDMKQVMDYAIANSIDTYYGWKVTDKSLVYYDKNKKLHVVPLNKIIKNTIKKTP